MPSFTKCLLSARRLGLGLACGLALLALPGWAQFANLPTPVPSEAGKVSQAETDQEYKIDAARHIYALFPGRVHKGRMPPLLYGVAIVETEVDAEGKVLDVKVRRPPAAPEVGPWIVSMIKRASPFPPPSKMGKASFVDIWLVDKGGNFQLDTLTEGQR